MLPDGNEFLPAGGWEGNKHHIHSRDGQHRLCDCGSDKINIDRAIVDRDDIDSEHDIAKGDEDDQND